MRSKMKGFKKFMAELLCTALIVCSLPGAAFAAEDEGTYKSSVSASYDADSSVGGGSVKDTAAADAESSANVGSEDPADKNDSGDTGTKESQGTEETSTDTEKDSEDTGRESEKTDKDLSDADKDPGEASEGSDDTENADAGAADTKEDADAGTADTKEDADAGQADDEDDSVEDADEDTVDADSADTEEVYEEAEEPEYSDGAAVPGGISSSSADEEEGDEEAEDWLDGPLDDEIKLASSSNADGVACITDRHCGTWGDSFPTVQDAIDSVGNERNYIYMYADSTEDIIIGPDQHIILFLGYDTLTGTGGGSVITNYGTLTLVNHDDEENAYITGGNADQGGGIHNYGTLLIDGMIITENTAGSGGAVYNDVGGTVTLSSQSHYTEISNNEARDNGGSIYNAGTFNMSEGTISENQADNGGGIYNVGTFNMNGGTISEDSADYGGGIYNAGTVNMDGGTISENSAGYGAGVYNDGTLTINSIIVKDNTASDGGGIYNKGTIAIESGNSSAEICENEAYNGGGIYNDNGTVQMKGGLISSNKARSAGGGVFNLSGTIDLIGGSILKNTAGQNGGGVLSNVGSFNMSGGEISDNYCEGNGGGMYLNGQLHMSGGRVDNNEAASKGGGIYLNSGEPYFKGTPVVESNTDKNGTSNVYMPDSMDPYYLTLEGELESGASVGVTPREELTADNAVQVTRPESDTTYYVNSAPYFFYDADSSYLGAANTEKHYVELTRSMAAGVIDGGGTTYRGRYMSLKEALDVAQNGDTVIMLADSTDRFTLSSGRNITLDLNGYTLSGEGEGIVIIIEEGATLTLDDSGDSGTITNGSRYNYGVGVNNRGTFNMKGGTISGNRATGTNSYGAGVFNGGTFNMSGGTISGNQADYGGGLYNSGTFNLSGGKIAENTASRRGTDIYSAAGSSMALVKASVMLGNEDPDKCYGWYMDSTGRYSANHITAEYTDPAVVGASTPGIISEDTALIAAGDAGHIYSEAYVTLKWSGEDNNENCTAIFTCTDCGYEKAVEAEFTYDLIREATDTEPALAIYYVTAITSSRGGETVIYTISEERSGNPPGGSGTGTTFVRSSRSASANASGGSYSVSSTGTGVISNSQNYDTGTWSEDIFGNWRFISDSGKMYENEWGYIYNPYANVAIGQPEANWFHFGYNGIMDTGWFVDTDGIVYFLNAIPDNTQGRMMTGWQWLNGNWYYFAAGGGMMRNAQTPDGYRVDENGVLIAE